MVFLSLDLGIIYNIFSLAFLKRGCEFKTPDSERMQSVVDQSCDGSGCRMISRRY